MNASEALTPDGFTRVLREQLESEIKIFPARAWWPSQMGHPCDRFLVWGFTKWQDKARHDWVLQSIFDEGNLHQPSVYSRLEKLGFEIIRESDRPTQYKLGNGAVISGRIDGKVRGFRGERYPLPHILEIKTMQGHAFDRLSTVDDLKAADQHYIRGYVDTGYIYGLLENLPQVVMVPKSKSTGLIKVIPFEIDYGRAEWLVQRAERLQVLVDKVIDPDPIPYDADVCGRCAFKRLCYPPKDYGAGAVLLEDSGLVEDIVRREAVAQARKEYEGLDKSIKARLKRLGLKAGGQVLVGPFSIEVSERPMPEYKVAARTDTLFEFTRLAVGVGPREADSQAAIISEANVPSKAIDQPAREAPLLPGFEPPAPAQPTTPAAEAAETRPGATGSFPVSLGAGSTPDPSLAAVLVDEGDPREGLLTAIATAKGQLERQPPPEIWHQILVAVCGEGDLMKTDPAVLNDLLTLVRALVAKDAAAIACVAGIIKRSQG